MSGGESLWRAQWSEHSDPFAHLGPAQAMRSATRGPGFQRALSSSPSSLEGAPGSGPSGGRFDPAAGGARPHFGDGRVRGIPRESHAPAVSLGNRGRDDLKIGMRIFHGKFGYGTIEAIEGNKLEIEFEHAGRKRVLDTFVSLG